MLTQRSLVDQAIRLSICCAAMAGLLMSALTARAIEIFPNPAQIAAALERGKSAASSRIPPDHLYGWFGSAEEFQPRGFLMTKMIGLTVMAAHFALRGETPGESEIRQILDDQSLLVSVTIFGNQLNFGVDTYMVLFQSERMVKPEKVRFDGRAARTSRWPQSPAYQAKVVASFSYADLVPDAKTSLSIFPSGGGEVSFDLDFSKIQ